MAPIAKAHDCSIAQVSLAWLLSKPVVTSEIIGARNFSQLEDNLKSVQVKLSAAEIAALDAVSVLPPEYPGWMLPMQDMGRLDPKIDMAAILAEHSKGLARKA